MTAGVECPDCGGPLTGRRCRQCGWVPRRDGGPVVSCWTCDRCGRRTPGQPVIVKADGPGQSLRGLCSSCHYDERVRPYASRPEEVCIAPECEGRPRHLIRTHIGVYHALVAELETRGQAVSL